MAGLALIIVDMLTTYDFDGADEPVLFVNDNYGHWNSSRQELVDRALGGRRGDLIEPLVPDDETLFIHKARHSIFFGTPLEYLLGQLDVDHLVLTGQVTEQCILYSALDAYVRHLDVTVVRDAVAHIDEDFGHAALEMMRRNMRAQIVAADELD